MISRRLILASTAAAVAGPAFAVTARAPKVGLTLPLTGVQASVAAELRQGYAVALKDRAEIVVLDDESKADKAAKHVEVFAADDSVVATSGIVGTPHAKAAIPKAVQGQLPMVGIRSGASELRDRNPWVHHLRASYEQEIDEVMKTAAIFGSIGVLYSDDIFGKATLAHAEKVAAAKGVKIVAKLAVERNGGNVRQQAAALANTPQMGAVLLCLIQAPALAAAKELRGAQRYMLPIFGMSFIATSTLVKSDDPALDGISLVSPFPLARVSVDEMASLFRTRMQEAGTPELIVSPTAFEGFFYGSVLAAAIERGGPSRKAIQAYLLKTKSMTVRQVYLDFDEDRVGYRYLALMRKAGATMRA